MLSFVEEKKGTPRTVRDLANEEGGYRKGTPRTVRDYAVIENEKERLAPHAAGLRY